MSIETTKSGSWRLYGALIFALIGAMLGIGIAWTRGAGLLPGLGWGLIACVVGHVAGIVVYYVVLD